jgi:hypothetical protein
MDNLAIPPSSFVIPLEFEEGIIVPVLKPQVKAYDY